MGFAEHSEPKRANASRNRIAGANGVAARSGLRLYPLLCRAFDQCLGQRVGRRSDTCRRCRVVPQGPAARAAKSASPVLPEDISITTSRSRVERIPFAEEQVRAWLPIEIYPVSAGFKGGLAGSVAMAVIACAYGLISVGSIWYPINLLAGVVYSQSDVAFTGAAKFVSRRSVFHRRNPAYHRIRVGGTTLRRHAAHDRAPPHSC